MRDDEKSTIWVGSSAYRTSNVTNILQNSFFQKLIKLFLKKIIEKFIKCENRKDPFFYTRDDRGRFHQNAQNPKKERKGTIAPIRHV